MDHHRAVHLSLASLPNRRQRTLPSPRVLRHKLRPTLSHSSCRKLSNLDSNLGSLANSNSPSKAPKASSNQPRKTHRP